MEKMLKNPLVFSSFISSSKTCAQFCDSNKGNTNSRSFPKNLDRLRNRIHKVPVAVRLNGILILIPRTDQIIQVDEVLLFFNADTPFKNIHCGPIQTYSAFFHMILNSTQEILMVNRNYTTLRLMKIGRNAPCPCGSGKKYKKCCIDKEAERNEQYCTSESSIVIDNVPREDGSSVTQEKSLPIQKLEELIERGPLRARSAVDVHRKVPLDLIENTPLIRMLQVFLETIARSGGRVSIGNNGRVVLDDEKLYQTAKMWPGIKPSISSRAGASLFPLHLSYSEILASELGCIGEDGEEIVLTEMGMKVIRNTKLRRVYNSALNKLTYTFNWFAFAGLPAIVEEIQDLCGLELFLLDYYYRNSEAVDEKNFLRQIDSIIPLIKRCSLDNIDEESLAGLIHDYFLGTYCYLFGFVIPSDEAQSIRGERWFVSKLYRYMFQWNL